MIIVHNCILFYNGATCHLIIKGQEYQDHRLKTFLEHTFLTCVAYVSIYNFSMVYT